MDGKRFLLGILSKINLYNTTFNSRTVTVAPDYADDAVYDGQYGNTSYFYDYDMRNDTNTDEMRNSFDSYLLERTESNNSVGMDTSSPLYYVGGDGKEHTTLSVSATGKPTGAWPQHLKVIIEQLREECVHRFSRTPRLQTGKLCTPFSFAKTSVFVSIFSISHVMMALTSNCPLFSKPSLYSCVVFISLLGNKLFPYTYSTF